MFLDLAAKLNKDQMTRKWINAKIKDMMASGDSELRETDKILQEHRSLVSPELWHYDISDPGKSSFSVLDPNAMVKHGTIKYLPSEFIEESIKQMCKSKESHLQKIVKCRHSKNRVVPSIGRRGRCEPPR